MLFYYLINHKILLVLNPTNTYTGFICNFYNRFGIVSRIYKNFIVSKRKVNQKNLFDKLMQFAAT